MKKIENVLNRMYNWKFSSAYTYAKESKNFPKNALRLLKELSEDFGNCGWFEGKIGDKIVKKNNQIAKILGYVWNDEYDYWIKET